MKVSGLPDHDTAVNSSFRSTILIEDYISCARVSRPFLPPVGSFLKTQDGWMSYGSAQDEEKRIYDH